MNSRRHVLVLVCSMLLLSHAMESLNTTLQRRSSLREARRSPRAKKKGGNP
jgi:hypothetical protein